MLVPPPEEGTTEAAEADVPSLPMEHDYEDDVSRVFISLNNSSNDQPPSPAAAAAGGGESEQKQQAGAEDGGPLARYKEEKRRAGALAEYFSSLFDESFCSHNFKLVG